MPGSCLGSFSIHEDNGWGSLSHLAEVGFVTVFHKLCLRLVRPDGIQKVLIPAISICNHNGSGGITIRQGLKTEVRPLQRRPQATVNVL